MSSSGWRPAKPAAQPIGNSFPRTVPFNALLQRAFLSSTISTVSRLGSAALVSVLWLLTPCSCCRYTTIDTTTYSYYVLTISTTYAQDVQQQQHVTMTRSQLSTRQPRQRFGGREPISLSKFKHFILNPT